MMEAQGHAASGSNRGNMWNLVMTWVPAAVVMVLTLVIWQVLTVILDIPVFILPSPLVILKEIGKEGSELLYHLGITMWETVGGFLIGSSLAFIFAVLFVHVRIVERSFYPWAIILQTIPIVALSPLFAIWMGYGTGHKMAIAAVGSFFPVLVNATIGLRSVSPQALELMQILSASKWDIFFRVRLPSSYPYLFDGLKISSTLAVVCAIVAEFYGSQAGIGYVVYAAGYRLDTRLIFAGITFSSLAGILFFQIISTLERILLRWPGARHAR